MAKAPSPGAGGSGAGRDTPAAGKERGIFEKGRIGDALGKTRGGARPPIYTPKDDGERGGYIGRAKTNAAKTARLMIDNGHFTY